MITRILNSRLPLMIYTPVKVFDASYFHAIYRSGALPVFDTEFLSRDDILEKAQLLARESLSFGLAYPAGQRGRRKGVPIFFFHPHAMVFETQ
jgi:hypothetical protein